MALQRYVISAHRDGEAVFGLIYDDVSLDITGVFGRNSTDSKSSFELADSVTRTEYKRTLTTKDEDSVQVSGLKMVEDRDGGLHIPLGISFGSRA